MAKGQTSNIRRRRIAILLKLGGKCCRCGFSDLRALQIDHIDGGGVHHLKSMGNGNSNDYHNEVRLNKDGKYQLLCANCNWIKRYEKGEGNLPELNDIYLRAMNERTPVEISFC